MKVGKNHVRTFLVAGQLTLVMGISCSLLNTCFTGQGAILDFLSGAFLGMSMVMNLTFLARCSHGRSKNG